MEKREWTIGERRRELRVAKVGEEERELGRGQHALVDDRAGGEAGDVRLLAGGELDRAADDEEAALERVDVGGDRGRARSGPGGTPVRPARALARRSRVDRDVAPAEHALTRAADFLDQRSELRRGAPGRPAGSTCRRVTRRARATALGRGSNSPPRAAEEGVGEARSGCRRRRRCSRRRPPRRGARDRRAPSARARRRRASARRRGARPRRPRSRRARPGVVEAVPASGSGLPNLLMPHKLRKRASETHIGLKGTG